jgi:hypothetical protein
MIRRFKFPQPNRFQTMERLKFFENSEAIQKTDFFSFSIQELKKVKSEDLQILYGNAIDKMQRYYLKNVQRINDEKITYIYECEMKVLIRELRQFRDECLKHNLSTSELENECVKFIIDKNKRFIFKSKRNQGFYNFKNTLASSSLGYWGFRSVSKLGSIEPSFLPKQIFKSLIPICFFTGVTLKFWSYIMKPVEPVSDVLDRGAKILLSPIWLVETVLNKLTGNISKKLGQTPVPLNITGEIVNGIGLSWKQLDFIYKFVIEIVDNIEYFE